MNRLHRRNTPIGTVWRRALRRVDRRAATYVALAHAHGMRCARGSVNGPCLKCAHADTLLREACRLANNLAR